MREVAALYGAPSPLPRSVELSAMFLGLPWAAFTAAIYLFILYGGFVRVFGHDHSLTLAHYAEMFSVTGSLGFTGAMVAATSTAR